MLFLQHDLSDITSNISLTNPQYKALVSVMPSEAVWTVLYSITLKGKEYCGENALHHALRFIFAAIQRFFYWATFSVVRKYINMS